VNLAAKALGVAAGSMHSLVVLERGECWAWGRNDYGELGDGSKENRSRPAKLDLAGKVRSVLSLDGHDREKLSALATIEDLAHRLEDCQAKLSLAATEKLAALDTRQQ